MSDARLSPAGRLRPDARLSPEAGLKSDARQILDGRLRSGARLSPEVGLRSDASLSPEIMPINLTKRHFASWTTAESTGHGGDASKSENSPSRS